MNRDRGFTLIEMLVVIAIIAILAALIMTGITRAKENGRRAACTSNLKQISTAIELYKMNNNAAFPPWITILRQQKGSYLPDIGGKTVFRCPNDQTEGRDGGRPGPEQPLYSAGSTPIVQFENADKDGPPPGEAFWPDDGNHADSIDPKNSAEAPPGIDCSYMFEFNGYKCEWTQDLTFDENGDGIVTWYEAKMAQVRSGCTDIGGGVIVSYPPGAVPVMRCFWHTKAGSIMDQTSWVNNVRYNYAVDWSHPYWELDYK